MSVARDQESSSSSRCSYQVFLSFRGEDTRKTFTDHLHTALVDKGFRTFRDVEEIPRGESLKPELEKAIKQSRISIIVLSKNFASSTWCLDELVVILEWRSTSPHVVLPVFYDVEPSDLRNQRKSIGKAFARYEEQLYEETDLQRKQEWKEKIRRWRRALREVADLTGFPLKNQADGYESKFIKKVVNWVGDKLSRTVLNVHRYFGIDSQAKHINLWLQEESTTVGMVAICGMGGVGKTTLAKVIYNNNFERFDGCSFISNVRELSRQTDGLVEVQKQFISDVLKKKEMIGSVDEGVTKIQDAICDKRIILVLDDVDQLDQLNAVLGTREWICPGSKIIITTRHDCLLKPAESYKVHRVEMLGHDDSIKLFSLYAFGQDRSTESYTELTRRVVHHCGGLPLALQVLGSSLNGKNEDVWVSALDKLEVFADKQIFEKLKISYDSLQDDHDKDLFLHIACFFVGKDEDCSIKILDGCDFFTKVGIENLIDRCLLNISVDSCKLTMHQLIRDMGREIVRQESPGLPGKRSRLWRYKDSFGVLRGKIQGTETIGGLFFDMQMFTKDEAARTRFRANDIKSCCFEIDGFAWMNNLKLLQLNYVLLTGCYKKFPTELRMLCWHGFPLQSIPNDFSLESLVFLDMQYSSLKQVWKGAKSFGSLKILDLSHSHGLGRTPDFSGVPNLERLILKDCVNLIEVCESIGVLETLALLDLEDCKKLRKLPRNIHMLISLQTLIISGCSNLDEFPKEMGNMESLEVLVAGGIAINAQQIVNGQVSGWHTLFPSWVPTPRKACQMALQVLGLLQQEHANFPDFSQSLDQNMGSHQTTFFTPDEDEALCHAWLAVTGDAVKCIDHPRTGKWRLIADQFNHRMGKVTSRTVVSLNSRWLNIQKAVIKFHRLYQKLERTHWSRENEQDMLSHVKSSYLKVQKEPFKFETCYFILKDNPEWNADLLTRFDRRKKPQGNLELEFSEASSEPSTTSVPVTPMLAMSLKDAADTLVQPRTRVDRPTGRNIEKKNVKQVNEGSSSLPDILRNLDVRLQRLEQKQNKDTDIRENNLQIGQLLQELRKKEEQIMEKDLSKLPPEQAEYWRRKQEIIWKKWMKELQEEERSIHTSSLEPSSVL